MLKNFLYLHRFELLPRTKARIVEYYVTNSNIISFVDVVTVRIA